MIRWRRLLRDDEHGIGVESMIFMGGLLLPRRRSNWAPRALRFRALLQGCNVKNRTNSLKTETIQRGAKDE
jgi:hypothetical protein